VDLRPSDAKIGHRALGQFAQILLVPEAPAPEPPSVHEGAQLRNEDGFCFRAFHPLEIVMGTVKPPVETFFPVDVVFRRRFPIAGHDLAPKP
jgi:hypothetical protein